MKHVHAARDANLLDTADLIEHLLEFRDSAKEMLANMQKELDKERVRKEASYRHEAILQEQVDDLRKQRFRNYNDEEYIIFMDDGEDYPESMVCPVVMSADQFRELHSARDILRKLAADPVFHSLTKFKFTNNL